MPGKNPVIPRVLSEHLTDLHFLWEQHRQALQSPDFRRRDLAPLEARIAAHGDAIVVSGEAALPLLEEGLASEEAGAVFAAAYPLLRMGATSAKRVLDAFLQAKEGQLDGIAQAFCQSSIASLVNPLRQALEAAPAPIAAAAAEVLAFHRLPGASPKRLEMLLHDEDPAVRRRAWRVMSLQGAAAAR